MYPFIRHCSTELTLIQRKSLVSSVSQKSSVPSFSLQHMVFVVRCYVMLAAVHGDGEQKIEDLLVAHHYVEKIWETSVDRANIIDATDKGVLLPGSSRTEILRYSRNS